MITNVIEECVNNVFLSVWVNMSKFKGKNNELLNIRQLITIEKN